jgi:hypothetical protein
MSEVIGFSQGKDGGYQFGWAVGIDQRITSTGGQGVFDCVVYG